MTVKRFEYTVVTGRHHIMVSSGEWIAFGGWGIAQIGYDHHVDVTDLLLATYGYKPRSWLSNTENLYKAADTGCFSDILWVKSDMFYEAVAVWDKRNEATASLANYLGHLAYIEEIQGSPPIYNRAYTYRDDTIIACCGSGYQYPFLMTWKDYEATDDNIHMYQPPTEYNPYQWALCT